MVYNPETSKEVVSVDRSKKRIYLVFEGFLSAEEAQKLKMRYSDAIGMVGRGYTVLSFFKNFVPATAEVQEVFLSMIDMANSGGCKKAARVSSGSVLGPLQMGRLARQSGYPSRHVETWEEAEAYLDSDED